MKPLILKVAAIALGVMTTIIIICIWGGYPLLDLFVEAETSQQQIVSKDDLTLVISAEQDKLTVGEYPKILASITNVGSNVITLVQPGDGSEDGWRTPIIKWTVFEVGETIIPPDPDQGRQIARCGNINPLRREEVFKIRPGESKEMKEWISLQPFSKPGVYKVSMVYENIPSKEWGGLPLGEHDRSAMKQVKRSAKCLLISNQIQFTVK
jgi:hypothetical protein